MAKKSFCQNKIPIKGILIDAITKQKVTGATISLRNGIHLAVSDIKGQFSINIILPAELQITSIGYDSLFFVLTDNSIVHEISLHPKTISQPEISIIGSRGKARTDITRPVPVDIISRQELERTGQIDLAQMVQFTSPSFNSVKTGLNGIANYADPANLKGMSSDQSLVMINHKRRHQFAAISNTLVPGKGSVVTDLNSIPSLALERIEIMRDGSAAQYGSDAIAGIINLILRKNSSGGTFKTETGITHEGDGITISTSINKGWKLKKPESFFNITLSYQSQSGTDRSDPFNGTIYSTNKITDDSIRNTRGRWPVGVPAYVMKYGSNKTIGFQSFLNFSYPIQNNWKWYGFGGTSNKEITAYGFFRTAKSDDPNSSPLYPDGYTPLLPGKTLDFSFITGFEKENSNGLKIDLSTGYGYNHLDLFSINSCNPSLGISSPTNFYVGRNSFGQSSTEANFSKSIKSASVFKSMNIAWGSQFRTDLFKMKEGDAESYLVGPLAVSENKAAGSSGRPGIALSDRTTKRRSNFGAYLDVEVDVKESFLLAIASRYENYSDFGSNLSGKIASRVNLTKSISIRGSINRGFRAPSLQQIYNRQTTSNAQNGVIRQTKQLPADDKRLSTLGIPFPKPELSWNYNIGASMKMGKDFIFSIDAYQIDVSNRIIISETLPVSSAIPSLLEVFPISTGIREITFFTNFINTKTTGIDIVSSWKHNFSNKFKIQNNIVLSNNKTIIAGQKNVPEKLSAGALAPFRIIDTISQSLITQALPRQKYIATTDIILNHFSFTWRITYFGKVAAYEKPIGLPHRLQVFSDKTVSDLNISYKFKNKTQFTIGVNNIFNVYPDRVNPLFSSYTNGQVPYSRSAFQFGYNGMYFFSNIQIQF